MNDLNKLYATLSPVKRALLEKQWLQKYKPARESRLVQHDARPLSSGQESLWFFNQLEPDSAAYNLAQAFRLSGHLNVEALRRSFEAVVHRHESLRTNFVLISEVPAPAVSPCSPFVLPLINLSADSEAERTREVENCLQCEARRPFNLAKDLLLRGALLKLAENDHILIVLIHHIAADAWSLSVLSKELSALYQNFCDENLSTLPKLESQFSDFAFCQRARFQGELAAKQITYWKNQLAGELPVLELPVDRPRAASQSFQGALEYFNFSPALLTSLQKLSRSQNVTVNALALAAFQVLLHRYSRQDDILVGCPLGNRPTSETEKLIGYFINTAVVRGNLSCNPAFLEVAHRANQNIFGALTNPDVPLEKLVEELKVARPAGRNPLVEVLFQYLPTPPVSLALKNIKVEPLRLHTGTAMFDLTLTLHASHGRFIGELEYNTGLFDAATIKRMLGHFQVLLEAVVTNPVQNIADLPLLTKAEEEQLASWNATEVPHGKNIVIYELFQEHALNAPDTIAVICGDHAWSYAELNQRANQLANYLKQSGVGPETPVGLCFERSVEMILGILAIHKAGGAYVPLDPNYPKDRLSIMLEETSPPIVLTQEKLLEKIPAHRGTNFCIDTNQPDIDQQSRENLPRETSLQNLAYVIFTSGSTGKPKGVLVSHGNLVHSTMARLMFYREPVTNYLLISSFSFDSSVAGIFWTLSSGGTLTLPQEGLHNDPAELIRLIQKSQVSHFLSLPSLYHLVLENAEPKQLESLKVVIVAGESCGNDLVERHHDVFEDWRATLFNEYGPTENSVWSTVEVCCRGDTKKLTIGKPIPNSQIYIFDPQQRSVPIGVPGEIYAGGPGIVRGYLNHPDLTAEKFVPNPFQPAERLYRTGDLASFRADGKIDFLGRVDHQVKLRGYRIELEEIEAHLKQLAREAVVVVRDNAAGEKSLVAYLVGAQVSATSELRAQLENNLPEHMVPSAFVFLDALPLTPNGKVDRKKLPAPDLKYDAAQFVAPQTTVEKQVAQIWNEVLGLKQIGLYDNFFDLGGHSLLAARTVLRLRRVSERPLGLREFFQSPTIPGVSAILEQNDVRQTVKFPELVPLARKRGPAILSRV